MEDTWAERAGLSATFKEVLEGAADAIVAAMVPQLACGDVVAILSNGGFDGIYEKLPTALRSRFPSA